MNQKNYYNNNFITIYKITIISLLVSIITVLRYILIFLPNVELVTFFLMIITITFTIGISFTIINVFCLVQIILFGFPDLAYFYIFNLYWLFFFLIKNILLKNKWLFSFLIFLCGLFFGFLYSIEYYFLFNFQYALMYWLSGLIFDIIHAVGNCILSILLFNFIIYFFKIISEKKFFIFNQTFLNKIINNNYLKEKKINKKN